MLEDPHKGTTLSAEETTSSVLSTNQLSAAGAVPAAAAAATEDQTLLRSVFVKNVHYTATVEEIK